MPRKTRICAPQMFHHVVHRGIDRNNIFLTAADYYLFLSLLREACRDTSARVAAYCLMDNHYHLFIEDCQGHLSHLMQLINGTYTLAFNKRHRREGAILRGRFFSRPVADGGYALTLMRYIHLNPVRAKMVALPSRYVWSSAKVYLEGRPSRNITSDYVFSLLQQANISPATLDSWTLQPEDNGDLITDLPSIFLPAGSTRKCWEQTQLGFTEDQVKAEARHDHLQLCRQRIALEAERFGLAAPRLRCTGKKSTRTVSVARYHAIAACIDELRATHAEVAQLFGLREEKRR